MVRDDAALVNVRDAQLMPALCHRYAATCCIRPALCAPKPGNFKYSVDK
nr:hypothetical protein [uncultured Massilia sp.]